MPNHDILTQYLSERKTLTTKEKLLSSAIACFKEKGYHRSSTREIASASGIKNSSLFYFFETKENLAVEAIKELTRFSKHYFSSQATLNGALELFAYDFHTTCLPLGLLFELPEESKVQDAARDYFQSWYRMFKETLNLNEIKACQETLQFFNNLLLKKFWPQCAAVFSFFELEIEHV
jgi:AcrR family transcriptional regulator